MDGAAGARRFSAGIWMFGRFIDRFATDGYGAEVSMQDAIRAAATVEGLEALDLNFPFWGPGATLPAVRAALDDTGLRAQAITPEIYTRKFRLGAFTNPDPGVRREALDPMSARNWGSTT